MGCVAIERQPAYNPEPTAIQTIALSIPCLSPCANRRRAFDILSVPMCGPREIRCTLVKRRYTCYYSGHSVLMDEEARGS